MTDQPPITDHTYRVGDPANLRNGKGGGPIIGRGMCVYNASCNRPEADHITDADFRAQRGTTHRRRGTT